MQEELRFVDQNQAVATDRTEDIDDYVGEESLPGTELDWLSVKEERYT